MNNEQRRNDLRSVYCVKTVNFLKNGRTLRNQLPFLVLYCTRFPINRYFISMKQILLVLFFFTICGAAAVAQTAKSAPLKVFPNPASEFISVADQGDMTGYISVYNIMGRNLREFEYVKDERYYIGDLPKGIYLIHLQDKNKKTISSQKIEKR